MFDDAPTPRLFALPPGADFPRLVVEGITARLAGHPPETMAAATLYLNTGRMLRRIRAAFADHGARFLPRMRLITDLGREPLAGVAPPVPPLRRRLELMQLVTRLLAREPDIAPQGAAFALADSLARLLDEMQGEGVSPEVLAAPGLAEDHAAHWERSLTFLRIIARYHGDDAAPDAEARQRRVVAALVARWQADPPTAPVIVAGSTGSRGTTAMLIEAVARLPQGAVILPGFDFDMPDFGWNSLDSGPVPNEDHPQFRFLRLMRVLAIGPADVRPWTAAAAPDPARGRVISLALRPAPVTDQWLSEGAGLSALDQATGRMTLIAAETPRAEATAIALILREAAETGRRAALITPDRTLSRRVAAVLDRWGIVPDDSAGQPLSLSPPGRFLRQVAGLFGRRAPFAPLLALLKHPLCASGGDRGEHLRLTRDLELRLRRRGPAFPDGDDIRRWAASAGDATRIAWADWLGTALDSAAAIADQPLADLARTHLALAEALAAGPAGDAGKSGLWQREAGIVARRAMDQLEREAVHGGTFSADGYAELMVAILARDTVRQTEAAHPAIAIWGTLEARVQGCDLVILGGLNERIWPQATAPDPWMSRQMRLRAGLLLPERQIGLSAHDFQQAAGAPEVVLARAVRDAEAETVPSRWLARLVNLLQGLPAAGGPEALAMMRARGDRWLRLAAALDTPAAPVSPAPRPSPHPPVTVRPRELPVTAIRTLIRDPYAVYVERILRLRPLDPLLPEPGAALRGLIVHQIIERFIRERQPGETDEPARARLLALAEEVLEAEISWPGAQRLWLAKLARIADRFITAEAARQLRGEPVIIEQKGSVRLDMVDFTLTARPDRIDLLTDGRVHIHDYKTGKPPTPAQMKAFEKQLLLEAAMAERGGFAALGPRRVEAVSYIQLGGDGAERRYEIDAETTAEVWRDLNRLIAAYNRRETGYTARRALFERREAGVYDHLARHGEWQVGDAPGPEEVG